MEKQVILIRQKDTQIEELRREKKSLIVQLEEANPIAEQGQ